MCGEINSASETGIDLVEIWRNGYSIAELWGFSKPVSRGSAPDNTHLILWGILGIVEYQVDRNAGHAYLRDRLRNGDWIAMGVSGAENAEVTPGNPPTDNGCEIRSKAISDW
jgi:hypothetical protein